MKIKIYLGRDKQYHIQFKARNGRILLDAGGYNTAASAKKTVTAVVQDVVCGKFELEPPKKK